MVVDSSFPRWISACTLILAIQSLVLTTACGRGPEPAAPQGHKIVIFIDFSASITKRERALFEQDISMQILPSLSAGDEILIAAISDKTLTDFYPLAQGAIPPTPKFSGWTDNVLKHKMNVKGVETQTAQAQEKIKAQVAGIFAKENSSQQTDILSSLLIAEKLFHNEPRRKVLVLMSDMIVDYPPYHFDRITWTPDTYKNILSEIEAQRSIPDLSGICVYVTGVSASSAALATNISRFWHAYFQRARADMDPSRYAHTLLHWPPSKSCRD